MSSADPPGSLHHRATEITGPEERSSPEEFIRENKQIEDDGASPESSFGRFV
jgi:hypothetical protein